MAARDTTFKSPRSIRWAHANFILLAAALLAGCGSTSGRKGLTVAKLEADRATYSDQARREHNDSMLKLARRLKREVDDFASGKSDQRPVCDILVLSGGADYGAFGAGVLQGWGEVRQGAFMRPDFDVVSGVSTGALIAPFALIGDANAYQRAFRLYQEPKEDWIQRRGLLFFLPQNESLLDTTSLQKDIRREVNPNVVRQIAEASRQGKVLRISATNLDYGQRRIWDLGREAELALQFNKGDIEPVHRILLASSAIPGAFSPVEIDGHLYVDGATTANILYEDNMQSPDAPVAFWKREYPGIPVPKMRYWVIINNQLEAPPVVTQATWVGVVEQSLSTSVRASTATSVQHLATQLALLRVAGTVETEFHVISIPNEWRPPKPGVFVKETMVSLAKLGREMGRDPSSWKQQSLVPDPPLTPTQVQPSSGLSSQPATAPATRP